MDFSVIDAISGDADFAFGKAAVSEINLQLHSLVSEYRWLSLAPPEFSCSTQQDFADPPAAPRFGEGASKDSSAGSL